MECYTYKGGVVVHVLKCLKKELAWAIEKWFKFTISYYTIALVTCKVAID